MIIFCASNVQEVEGVHCSCISALLAWRWDFVTVRQWIISTSCSDRFAWLLLICYPSLPAVGPLMIVFRSAAPLAAGTSVLPFSRGTPLNWPWCRLESHAAGPGGRRRLVVRRYGASHRTWGMAGTETVVVVAVAEAVTVAIAVEAMTADPGRTAACFFMMARVPTPLNTTVLPLDVRYWDAWISTRSASCL